MVRKSAGRRARLRSGHSGAAKLYTRQKQWQKLAAVHSGEAEATNDPQRRASAYARMGADLRVQLSQVEQAVQYHARALGIVPGYAPSFKALTRLYTQAQRFPELAELYEARGRWRGRRRDQDHVPVQGRTVVRRRAAGARAGPDRVPANLDVDGQHLGASHALQRAPNAPGASRIWCKRSSSKPKDPGISGSGSRFYTAPVKSRRSSLGDDDAALALFRKIYDLDRTYAPAWPAWAACTTRPAATRTCSRRIKPSCASRERTRNRRALLYKKGELYEERVGRDEDAIVSYRKAIEMDPFNQQALHALGRKLTERNRFDEYVKLLDLS